jgi:hypothetical protein
VLLNTPDPTDWVIAHLGNTDKLALARRSVRVGAGLLADARLAAVGGADRAEPGDEVRDESRSPRCATPSGRTTRADAGVVSLARGS